MEQLILVVHVFVAIGLVALVLLQHGKGADIGAAFGSGASSTVFGSIGAVPFLMKITALLAAVFFATSLTLTYTASRTEKHSQQIYTAPQTSASEIDKKMLQGLGFSQSQSKKDNSKSN